MQIVINISKKLYDRYKEKDHIKRCDIDEFEKALDKCIILPKGYGRLGDLSKVYDKLNDAQIEGTEEYKGLGEAKQIVCDTSTIIEADKESEVEE